MSAFSLLPPELLYHCFDFLDYRALLVCRSVCRELKLVVDTTTACQYTLALASGGLEDAPSSTWSVADKLSAARRHERAWRTLEYSSYSTFPYPVGGLWELYGGVWAHNVRAERVFQFVQLPSEIRKVPMRTWELALDVEPRDFTFEPSQDLLVLIVGLDLYENPTAERGTIYVHLRTLFGGLNHPRAKSAVLEFPSESNSIDIWSYNIRICGKHVGVFRNHYPDIELVVWNWVDGTQVFRVVGSGTVQSFTFLDEDAIIVASLYSPDSPREAVSTPASLIVYDLSPRGDGILPEARVHELPFRVALQLPPQPIPNESNFLHIHADPSPLIPTSDDGPFHVAQRERLLAVNTCCSLGDQLHAGTSVVPFDLFRHCAAQYPAGTVLEPEHWARACSPQLAFGHWSVWVCFVYGMRYVRPRVAANEDGKLALQVYDFHRLRCRAGAALDGVDFASGNEGGQDHLRCAELVLPDELQVPQSRALKVMVSEDSVIALPASGFGADRKVHVFTF